MLSAQIVHWILLLFQIVMVLFVLNKTRYNLGIPSNITIVVLTLGYSFYCLGYELWGQNLHPNTFLVYYIGFLLLAFLSLTFKMPKAQECENSKLYMPSQANISVWFAICIVAFFLYMINLFIVARNAGIGFLAAISYAKTHSGSMNILIKQGFKLVTVSARAALLLLILNKKRRVYESRVDKQLIILVILGCVITIFSGSRGDILKILACFFPFIYLFSSFTKKQFWQVIKRTLPNLIAVFAVFYFSRVIVKSAAVATGSLNLLDYICFYFGGPIDVLNTKLQNLTYYNNGYFCANVFYDLYHDFIEWGLLKNITWNNPFVYVGNFDFGGNVATFYFPFICDLGYIFGMICILLVIFWGNKKYAKQIKQGNFWTITLFGYFYSIFVFAFYDSVVYQIFSFTGACEILVLFLIYVLLYKVKIRVRLSIK